MDINLIDTTNFMLSTRALDEISDEDIQAVLKDAIPSQELIRVLRFVKFNYDIQIPFNVKYEYYKNLINQICDLTIYTYEESTKELALVFLLSFVHFLDNDEKCYNYVLNYYNNNKQNQSIFRDEEWFMFEEVKGRILQNQTNSHEWDINLVKELTKSLKEGKETYLLLQKEFFGDLDNTW